MCTKKHLRMGIIFDKRFVIALLNTLFALGGCNPFNSNDIEGSIYEIGENSIKIEVLGR